MTWSIWLPYPVSDNAYYRRGKSGRSKVGRLFADACLVAVRKKYGTPPMIAVPVTASYVLFPPDKRVRDGANYSKSLWDALSYAPGRRWHGAGLLKDDCYIKRGTWIMGETTTRDKACVLVIIDECDAPAPTLDGERLFYPDT